MLIICLIWTMTHLVDGTIVWLTVGPNGREITIHWRYAYTVGDTDWIGLFRQEPKGRPSKQSAIQLVDVWNRVNGSHQTSVHFPHLNFNKSQLFDKCLGYFVAYIQYNEILVKNCFKT